MKFKVVTKVKLINEASRWGLFVEWFNARVKEVEKDKPECHWICGVVNIFLVASIVYLGYRLVT